MAFLLNERIYPPMPCACPECMAAGTAEQRERRRVVVEHHKRELRKRMIHEAVERVAGRRAVGMGGGA